MPSSYYDICIRALEMRRAYIVRQCCEWLPFQSLVIIFVSALSNYSTRNLIFSSPSAWFLVWNRLLNIGIGRSDGFTECEIFGHLMDEIEKFWIWREEFDGSMRLTHTSPLWTDWLVYKNVLKSNKTILRSRNVCTSNFYESSFESVWNKFRVFFRFHFHFNPKLNGKPVQAFCRIGPL